VHVSFAHVDRQLCMCKLDVTLLHLCFLPSPHCTICCRSCSNCTDLGFVQSKQVLSPFISSDCIFSHCCFHVMVTFFSSSTLSLFQRQLLKSTVMSARLIIDPQALNRSFVSGLYNDLQVKRDNLAWEEEKQTQAKIRQTKRMSKDICTPR
jgi:hypothetical protein